MKSSLSRQLVTTCILSPPRLGETGLGFHCRHRTERQGGHEREGTDVVSRAARDIYFPRIHDQEGAWNLTCCLPPEAGRKA